MIHLTKKSHTILIADGGSTKTEWCLVRSDGRPKTAYSDGLNPFYHTVNSVADVITQEVIPEIPSADRICFYGAGCAGDTSAALMTEALNKVYGDIPVEIHSDVFGAARALFGHDEGIACILGTGSNSCHFNGEMIVDEIPVLGFVLGDEGSAGSFGRKILQGYFYREMPEGLCEWLELHYKMDRSEVLESVYKKPHFNTYVASFSRLFAEFSDHPYVIHLLQEGVSEFLDRHVLKYRIGREVSVGFVGAVAWHNQEAVKSALARKGLKAGAFMKSPMEGLQVYHSAELTGS